MIQSLFVAARRKPSMWMALGRRRRRRLQETTPWVPSPLALQEGIRHASTSTFNNDVDDDDDNISMIRSLPWQYLRASDPSNYDAHTFQRTDVTYDVQSGKPAAALPRQEEEQQVIDKIIKQHDNNNSYRIEWKDGVISTFPMEWFQEYPHYNNFYNKNDSGQKQPQDNDRILWSNLTEEQVRASPDMTLEFDDLIQAPDGMRRGLKALYQYGILLVTNTPIDDNGTGIAAMGAALGGGNVKTNPNVSLLARYRQSGNSSSPADANHSSDDGDDTEIIMLPYGTDGPLRTLYGTVWSTSSGSQTEGLSLADSAYGSEGLPLHTDMTYMRDPPGLQIFTMVQPAVAGGESVFADGFCLAETLRTCDPHAFDVLSQTVRRYRSIDTETGWNLQATGPVIQLDPSSSRQGRVVGIRHNDLDRLPDLPPHHIMQYFNTNNKLVDEHYDALAAAHRTWDDLIGQDHFRLTVQLQPGDTMVVANQRCFHGRCSFQSSTNHPRIVMGCYISQDELDSRFRMEGFPV